MPCTTPSWSPVTNVSPTTAGAGIKWLYQIRLKG